MSDLKQNEFKLSTAPVVLLGNPGGGKSTSIIEWVRYNCEKNIFQNFNILTVVFNKNAQTDLSKRMVEFNIKQKVQTFDSLHLEFNMLNDIRVEKPENNSNNVVNEYYKLHQTRCLENIKRPHTNIDFLQNIKVLIVDEAQDMNDKNYNLVKIISDRLNIPVITAGDSNQCIYIDLRGSDPEYMHKFSTNVIKLNINYRSTKPITELSKYFQNENHEMVSVKKVGPLPTYVKSRFKQKIYNHILKSIRKIQESNTIKLSEICIMTMYKEDGQVINKLLKKDKAFKTNNFNNDNVKIKEDGINIMTYYKSKGLEFNTVFLVDFQDIFRVGYILDNNLKYVGVTRAKEELYMYYNTYDEKYNKIRKENCLMKTIPRELYNFVEL